MQNNVIVAEPASQVYIIQAQGIAESKYVETNKAPKQFVLQTVADFITTATQELRSARAHNRATLRHFN